MRERLGAALRSHGRGLHRYWPGCRRVSPTVRRAAAGQQL